MTAGNSLRENEWVSRRKWTWTTFSSAAANAKARTGHGKRERDRGGRADVQLREVDPDGGERQGTGEQPDPCSHRQRLLAAEGSDEASGCGRVEVESRHIRDEDADPFPPATERQTTGPPRRRVRWGTCTPEPDVTAPRRGTTRT